MGVDGWISSPHATFSTRRDWERVAAAAATQHGVVTLAQLRGCGASDSAVRGWVACRRLIRLHAGVFAVGHALLRAEGHYLAAVLACGPGAALSYRSAAALQEIRASAASRIDVSAPNRAGRSRDGIRVHRGDRLEPDELTVVEAIPCTTVSRTLLDLSSVFDRRGVEAAVETLERTNRFDLRSVTILLARHRGRRGMGRLRAVLSGFDPEALRARSELEARFFHLCADRVCVDGIPRPLVNRMVDGRTKPYEVDFHWPDARVIVETDSSFHDTAAARRRDAARDADLERVGWMVLRRRWCAVVTVPDLLVAELHDRLSR